MFVRTAPRGGSFEYPDMSHKAAISGPLPVSQDTIPSNQPLPYTLPIIIGIAGMVLFILSQMLVVAGAAVWAIGGYFHFHLIGFAVLAAIAWELESAADGDRGGTRSRQQLGAAKACVLIRNLYKRAICRSAGG